MSTETTTFSGIVPPIVTPLTLEGEVDTTSLERLLSLQIEAGVDGLFVLGSSGEVGYLTDAQRAQVVQTAIGHVGGQVPVLVGVNDMTTNRVIAVAEQAREAGADAIVATAPFYAITDAAETATHFRSIHAAVDLPLFAYDVPVRVHSKLNPAMLVELGREGVIAGVKDSSGDDVSFRMLLRQSAELENFAVFTGHEVVVDGCLLMGASGAVPGLANVDPHGYVRLWRAAQAGDWAAAKAEQDRLTDLFSIVEAPTPGRVSAGAAGLGAFKTALALRGVITGNTMCAPMLSLDESETATIKVVLERAGLL
ncbi:dihydrodipicolinate synthase family protein [Rhodococcus erythropolis]|jgi:4-hydroxy-tetrahydrodipicolinate synthase|uniref:Dihydrodipicolinate synthase family protein n=1 Tax=Rhodococcus baikonurensis TaxID=172041 RepID=A0ABV5XLJ8_9NOCA|nr:MULTISPECIES: dihydrodipicolinate synthase family protein [Rhodococcus]MBJ7481135.1 dihydrodipicolinate synthase family protein [Rhodococcus sp. (in: high G+C Gram-positive bacteria)]MDI9957078.1 dihydrodipicolinate synthase family protein [Rhodococcus sp. IEGM 1237]MDI9962381.1 dihydrodipicolinate synthase family protein [Rhodococcus sp. IEGM 1251]MDV8125569.1 dihydrodipicolinate synthase family protein [Rhodococcus sp. IEGM 1304]PBI85954.1 putative 2-keto-3-deoxy-galactonate aldolase YagE